MPHTPRSPILKGLAILMALTFLFACMVAAAQNRFDGSKSGGVPLSQRRDAGAATDAGAAEAPRKPTYFPATKAAPVPLRDREPAPQQQAPNGNR